MNPNETTAGLAAWLRDRLDEQEQAANDAIDEAEAHWPPTEFTAEWQWAYLTRHRTRGISGLHCAPGAPTPTQVLAEVAAGQPTREQWTASVRRVADQIWREAWISGAAHTAALAPPRMVVSVAEMSQLRESLGDLPGPTDRD